MVRIWSISDVYRSRPRPRGTGVDQLGARGPAGFRAAEAIDFRLGRFPT